MSGRIIPVDLLRDVLKAIESQSPINKGDEVIVLDSPDMSLDDASCCCAVLSELGFIESMVVDGVGKKYFYPVRITSKGREYLSEGRKTIWKYAGDMATGIAVSWISKNTGYEIKPDDVAKTAEFFKAALTEFA